MPTCLIANTSGVSQLALDLAFANQRAQHDVPSLGRRVIDNTHVDHPNTSAYLLEVSVGCCMAQHVRLRLRMKRQLTTTLAAARHHPRSFVVIGKST